MNAVVAGRAGLAVLLDGDAIWRMDVEDPGVQTPVRAEELPLLLDRESELVFLEDVDPEQVAVALDYEWRCQETLDLLLLSVDNSLSDSIRREVILELGGFLRAYDARQYVEKVLSAKPLPASADIDGARLMAATISSDISAFYDVVPSVRGVIGSAALTSRAPSAVREVARPRSMNKSEFINAVAEKAELTKAAAARVVDAIFDTASGAISEAVHAAGSLSIPGFGKFTRRTRAARSGRNPRTSTEIKIPERTTVGFSAGRGLKEQRSTSRRTAPVATATTGAAVGATTARGKKTTTRSTSTRASGGTSSTRPGGATAHASASRLSGGSKSTGSAASRGAKSGGAKSAGISTRSSAAKSAKPAATSAKPATRSAKPAARSAKPAATSVKPATRSATPAAKSAKPGAKSGGAKNAASRISGQQSSSSSSSMRSSSSRSSDGGLKSGGSKAGGSKSGLSKSSGSSKSGSSKSGSGSSKGRT